MRSHGIDIGADETYCREENSILALASNRQVEKTTQYPGKEWVNL